MRNLGLVGLTLVAGCTMPPGYNRFPSYQAARQTYSSFEAVPAHYGTVPDFDSYL